MAAGREKKSIERRPEAAWLGELIRSRRLGRFSLETLAKRAGISAGLLSEIERGMGNPSFFTLLKLSDALEIDPTEFFRFTSSGWQDEHIVRRADRQRMSLPNGRIIELLSPRQDLPLVMWKSLYPAGFDARSTPYTIATETSLIVVRGELSVDRADGTALHLAQGDTLRLEAGTAFGPVNTHHEITESIEASATGPL